MRKARELRRGLLTGIAAFSLAIGIFALGFAMNAFTSYAEGQVKVTTPRGANVRKEASASSDKVGGAENGQTFDVISQVQGSDGFTWYQIQLNPTTTGYIRSDLVEYIAETTPPAGEPASPADVTEVNPVSATVSKEGGKILDNAASTAQTVADVAVQTVLTVTGQATDAEGAIWYKVSFTSGENQVEGFIRDEFLTLSGDLTPATTEPPQEETPEPPQEEVKEYETLYQEEDGWVLYVRAEGKGYRISELFDTVKQSADLYEQSEKTVKTQKIVIIILVFLLVAAVAGIAFLVFKVRDMMDSAYFSEVENEALRKRKASDGQGKRKVTHTVGADRQPGRNAGSRPMGSGQGTRPVGSGQGTRPVGSGQGTRPVGSGQGTRPVGSGQGTRPVGSGQGTRPMGSGQGTRPVGSSQGTRPAGNTQGTRTAGSGQGTRPVGSSQGTRPAGNGQGTRPVGSGQGGRPMGGTQGARPAGSTQRSTEMSQGQGASQSTRPAQSGQGSAQKNQPKNFMADDDFDFEFLNYDEDGEQ